MVHALLEAGEQAVVLDNLSTGFDWAVPPGATLIVDDAGDQSRVGALIAGSNLISQITSRKRSYRDSRETEAENGQSHAATETLVICWPQLRASV